MPAIANIIVADATPTNHSLLPQQASLAQSTWMSKETATYEGNLRLSIGLSNPTKARQTTRVKMTFTCPFERTIDGVVVVPDTALYIVDAVIPASLSDAEALKTYTMFKNLMAHATVQSYLADRVPVW